MAEPQVQYLTTNDGVNIAYASVGEGPPILSISTPQASHVQRSWALIPNFYEPLAEAFRIIKFDPRGTGLSDRESIDFSMDTMIRDVESVVERTNPEKFSVVAFLDAVPVAVTYAAAHADQVTHLVLIDGFIRFDDAANMPARKAIEALIDQDFTLITETMTKVVWGLDDARLIEIGGEFIRSCIEPEAFRAYFAASRSYDVSSLLAKVRAKTLVLHNEKNAISPVRAGQKLAAGIPEARFQTIDDMSYQKVARLVLDFLGASPRSEAADPSSLHTILFTDIVGHTEMMSRLGDERGRDVLREHERITREALTEHGGDEVKTMGDGFMASFASVTKAVECAIALQWAFPGRESDEPLSVRVGINAGEPIEEDGDLFGATVILASRIAAKADGGEILVADTVRGLCSGKGFLFSDRGEFVAKGFEDAVRLFEVSWRDA